MSFDREMLPDAQSYFESEGLILTGNGPWRTSSCTFHGGSDSMRINLSTGGWICMACGVKGGDVLAHHILAHDLDFIDAAKALGAWQEVCNPVHPTRPKPLPASAALQVLASESNLIAIAAGNIAHGVKLTKDDLIRVYLAAHRIATLNEAFQ